MQMYVFNMTSFLKKILSCARCDALQAVYKKRQKVNVNLTFQYPMKVSGE